MKPLNFLLIISFKVLAHIKSSVYACGIHWVSTHARNSTITDDVKIFIFHPAMRAQEELVGGLQYNVTLSGELLKRATSVDMTVHAVCPQGTRTSDNVSTLNSNNCSSSTNRNNQEPDNVSTSNSNNCSSSNNQESVDNVDVACYDDDRHGKTPVSFFWKSPQNISNSCLYFTYKIDNNHHVSCIIIYSNRAVIQVYGRVIRSHPHILCKPVGCSHYFTNPSGSLWYNSSERAENDVRNCSFIIIGGSKALIELQFVEVEASMDGRCDNLISISSDDVTETQFCGRLTTRELRNHNYVMDSEFVRINLRVKDTQRPAVFAVVFSVYRNATGYSKLSGIITNLGVPNKYHPNNNIITRILLPPELRITVHVLVLVLGNNTNETCPYHALAVTDLQSNIVTIINCSKTTIFQNNEEIFQSRSSKLEIEFYSDKILEGKCVQLLYKATHPCSNYTLIETSGIFSSPNYPNNYLNGVECVHFVHFSQGDNSTVLELQFLHFYTESDLADSKLRNTLCSSDYLEITSGDSIARVCGDWRGNEHLLVFDALSAPVHLRFVTDSKNKRPGFLVTWRKVDSKRTCCQNVLESPSSRFEIIHRSQTWFDSDLDCRSRGGLLARIDDLTTHELLESHLQTSDCRTLDAVWIAANDLQNESDYVWSSGDKVKFSRWFPGWAHYNNYSQQPSDDGLSDEDCVEMRRLFRVPGEGSQVTSYFWNDRSCSVKNPYICRTDRLGLRSQHARSLSNCDVTVSLTHANPTRIISSLDLMDDHDFHSCRVTVNTPLGMGMALKLRPFGLEDNRARNRSDYHFWEITPSIPDKLSSTGSEFVCDDWSSNITIMCHVIVTNNITVTFRPDQSGTFPGFLLKTSILNGSYFCGDGDWLVTSSHCVMMSLELVTQDEASQVCELLNATLFYPTVGGTSNIINLLSMANLGDNERYLELWTSKDEQEPDKCLSATVSIVQTDEQSMRSRVKIQTVTCAAKLRFLCLKLHRFPGTTSLMDQSKINEPGNFSLSDIVGHSVYPPNLQMKWHIQAPDSHIILVIIYNVDIEFEEDCLYDYISIRESTNPDSICGQHNNSSIAILSNNSTVDVEFISDLSETGSGFSMSWQWVDMKQCHQEVKVDAKPIRIRSFNFPDAYPGVLDCSLTMRTVNLSFMIILNLSLVKPSVLTDGLSVSLTDGDAVSSDLNSSRHLFSGMRIFVSNTGYLKLTYFWPDGVEPDHGFEGHVFADMYYLNQSFGHHGGHFERCQESLCLNNGHCRQVDEVTASCECPPHYTGMFCELTWCSLKPCVQGLCEDTILGYLCACSEGYWGTNCQLDDLSCSRDFCGGRGRCLPGNTSHPVCSCSRDWSGPMCTQRLDGNSHETTLGQRMLKEPIWIGLIVIMVVVLAIGVLYVVRKRCGRYFTCCEVIRSKDDNILNSHGTIALNSFPLRQFTHPPGVSIISATSPSHPQNTMTMTDFPNFTPGVKICKAAAKFFASYKDTERSLVSTPLTTDFTRATDTSLSQDTSDSSVGAVVGGTLQLDLHIRENKEHEALARAKSDMSWMDTSSMIFKQSSCSGNFFESDYTDVDTTSQSSMTSKLYGKQLTKTDFNHIYPHVIVKSPNYARLSTNNSSYGNERANTDSPEVCYVDSSGAHIIEVDLEDDDDFENVSSEQDYDVSRLSKLRLYSLSADSIYQLEQAYPSSKFFSSEIDGHDLSESGVKEIRPRVLEEHNSANLVVHNEFTRRNRYRKAVKTRSISCIANIDTSEPNSMHRSFTLSKENSNCSDISRKSGLFLGQTDHLNVETQVDIDTNQPHRVSHDVCQVGKLSCECSECMLIRSASLTRNMSSKSRDVKVSRHKLTRKASHKDRGRGTCSSNLRSSSTNSDQATKHSRRRESSCSYVHKHKHKHQHKHKQSPSARSHASVKVNRDSSTDSDILKIVSRHCNVNIESKSPKCQIRQQHTTINKSPTPSLSVHVTETSTSDADAKDLFRKVFSQEIDLDDLSLPEEDDPDIILRPKLNSKQSFLASEPFSDTFPGGQSKNDTIIYFKQTSPDSQLKPDIITSSNSSGTPTTCNVIMYDSNRSLNNVNTPPTIKTHFYLTRKHSSLDLVEPQTHLHPKQQSLRAASSMHELHHIPQSENVGMGHSRWINNLRSLGSRLETEASQTSREMSERDSYTETQASSLRTVSSNVDITVDDYVDDKPWINGGRNYLHFESLLSSPENLSPQTRKTNKKSNHTDPNIDSTHYLSITDTDSAMSSAPSPQATPNICQGMQGLGNDPPGGDQAVKDSAYQTKQSSVETETMPVQRIRRPILPVREEDRRVTQRLHQAAVKLLVMQQRLRRARQNMSRDSAVHTISEDDAALDDITITSSSKSRTFKPGVLYPVSHVEEGPEFSPLQCSRIVEEHDAVIEYEV